MQDLFPKRLLKFVVPVKDNEIAAMLLAAAYFFFLLSGYYILRPLREEMGVAGGVRNLPWLWTATLVLLLALNPVFSAIVSRYPRRVFIPYVYRFFILNLAIFLVLHKLLPMSAHVNLGRVFYVWISAFNLFVVSIGWGFMTDIFQSSSGKRLFGFVAFGASLGGLIGSLIVILLAEPVGPVNLMVISMVLIEVSARCVRPLNRIALASAQRQAISTHDSDDKETPDREDGDARTEPASFQVTEDEPLRGSIWEGIHRIARSRYLQGICLYMFFLSLAGTFMYYVQAQIAERLLQESSQRVIFFATINFGTNTLAAIGQVFLVSRAIKAFGVGITLGLLPLIVAAGFVVLGVCLLNPQFTALLWIFPIIEVCRRGANYALSRPTRELLYTVVKREEKYKSKTFIDTVVTRGSDQVNAWGYSGLLFLGIGMASIMFVAVPLALAWFVLALVLGTRQKVLAAESNTVQFRSCVVCGHNVRAGPNKCPECGTAV